MQKKPASPRNDLRPRLFAGLLLVLGLIAVVVYTAISQAIDLSGMHWDMAETEADQRRGLGGREALDENMGMMFVFDQPGIYPFWMKDMKFAIDIIWLRGDQVVDLETLPPPAEGERPASRIPREISDKVLEIRSGRAEELGIKVGSKVDLP